MKNIKLLLINLLLFVTYQCISQGAQPIQNALNLKQDTSGIGKAAHTNAYSDLSGKPSIPLTQVNSDWSASSGVTQVLNKPTLFNGVYASLTGAPSIPTMFADSVKFYNHSGIVNKKIKIWSDTVSVTAASGFSVSISSASFGAVLCIIPNAMLNTATATSVPNVSIKSYTTSAVVMNFTQGSSNLVTLLATSVLAGAPTIFASTTGLKVALTVIGY